MMMKIKLLIIISQTDREMGETFSSEKQQPIEQRLHFVQQLEDPNFGAIQIFRFKEPPYEYIMDYRKTFMEGDKRIQYYCEFIKSLQSMEHKNLSKIHLFEMREQNHMCIKDRKAHVYCNYYNFTLAQAIEKKKRSSNSFPQNDLVYMMSCLASLAEYLTKFKIYLGEYRADRIYISPEGYIKLYLLELEEENKHNCYYKALVERSAIEEYILAPEQLKLIDNLEYDLKFDPEKADVFAIGMIILQLLTLDHPKFYYEEGFSGLKMGKIAFSLGSCRQSHSEAFVQLLKGCLHEDPAKRLTLEDINQKIDRLKKTMQTLSYCIRLQDEDEGSGSKKLQTGMNGRKAPSFPAGLGKHLTPTPITTISTNKAIHNPALASTSSSQFRGNMSAKQYSSKRDSTGLHSQINANLSTNSSHIHHGVRNG